MKIFGMGMPELIIILVVVLLLFGWKTLPKLGTAFGKTISNLRDGLKGDSTETVQEDNDTEEVEVLSESTDSKGATEVVEEVVEDAPTKKVVKKVVKK